MSRAHLGLEVGDIRGIRVTELGDGRRQANGLAADLKRHLNNEPVVARPPSTAYRLQKAWRRNKLAFTAGVAVAAALVIGIGISTWQAIEASRARNAEERQRDSCGATFAAGWQLTAGRQ